MKKKLITLGDENHRKILNELGKDGWELITFDKGHYTLKRRLP